MVRVPDAPRSGTVAADSISGMGVDRAHGATDPVQYAGETSRDLHLRDAELAADVLLGALLDEAHVEQSAVRCGEGADRGRHRLKVIDPFDRGVLDAQ